MLKLSPLLLLGALFAASTAGVSTPTKRQTTKNHIKDGSFEQISEDHEFDTNFSAGGWNFTGRATFDYNFECKPKDVYMCTPYGKNYVVFFKSGGGTSGSVFQPVRYLTGGQFTLNYAYDIAIVPGGGCSISSLLGSQVIDTLSIPPGSSNYQPWMNRTTTFVPARNGGNLEIRFHCAGGQQPVYYELYVDNVSLVGPV